MSEPDINDIAPDAVDVYVTCQTEGCANQGVPLYFAEIYGTVICGVCKQATDQISESSPELPTEVPEWLE